MASWLLDRLFDKKSQTKPTFAFNSTVNWMRALALLVDNNKFSNQELKKHFATVNRRNVNQNADTKVFENTLMAFHNFSCLKMIDKDISSKYDTLRSAIVAWYYCTYFSSKAMLAASSGGNPETHSDTAKIWHSEFLSNKNILIEPFSLHLNSLVKKEVQSSIQTDKNGNTFNVNKRPTNQQEAWVTVVSYLNGTAEYKQKKIEIKVKNKPEFKQLSVTDFRTKKAQKIRDKEFDKAKINFLVQAFRYRGKANYRDSLFLSYGNNRINDVNQLTSDLLTVSEKFLRMAACYT